MMSSDYIWQVPLTKWLLENYDSNRSSRFPGGGKTAYDTVLIGTHQYLNEHVHPTIQQRAPLRDSGLYLTDHGPRHIELVLRRASQLVQNPESLSDDHQHSKSGYEPGIDPYEAFLLALGVHFHDVGNMYGRAGHETRLVEVMGKIGPFQPIDRFAKDAIVQIAVSHGGSIEGDKDTIRGVPGDLSDGDVRYRPQLLAAVLRLADELADEHSRADNFGLMAPGELPAPCLIYHKYAEGLRVSIDLRTGRIHLSFRLHADDLRRTFPKVVSGSEVQVYLLDEIYERTLKTYKEMIYCGYYMRALHLNLHQVSVRVDVYESPNHSQSCASLTYVIGDTGYPDYRVSTMKALEWLARDFAALPDGATFARSLTSAGTVEVNNEPA